MDRIDDELVNRIAQLPEEDLQDLLAFLEPDMPQGGDNVWGATLSGARDTDQ